MWALVLLIVIISLSGMENYFRIKGHRPSVIDSKALWAYWRQRIYDEGDKRTVVLLGASQIQLGFSPKVFEAEYPIYRVVQLAIDGTSGAASLFDLADDQKFNGIVILSTRCDEFLSDMRQSQQPYVDFYHERYDHYWLNSEEFSVPIKLLLQERFTILYPILRPDNILKSLIREKRLPRPFYIITYRDRSRSADYARVDISFHREYRIANRKKKIEIHKQIEQRQWIDQAMEYEPFVLKILSRGGKVVYFRPITSGEHWDYDKKEFPKSDYWDQLSQKSRAITIHFADVPSLSNFDCPDTSHLDYHDSKRFTLSLGQELERLSVIHR